MSERENRKSCFFNENSNLTNSQTSSLEFQTKISMSLMDIEMETLKDVVVGVNLPSSMQGRLPNSDNPSVWGGDTLLRQPIEGYHEMVEEIKKLGIKNVRLSASWSHIMKPSDFGEAKNQLEVDRKKNLLKHLKEAEIKVTLTLHHFDEPQSFEKIGGFRHKENLLVWKKYVEVCAEEFGGLVDACIPINEPNIYTPNSHIFGIWPPHGKSIRQGAAVFRNLAEAHIMAVEIMKKANPDIQVGCAVALPDIQPGRNFPGPVARWASRKFREISPFNFIDKVKDTLDFVGIQSYFPQYIGGNKIKETSDMGWVMDRSGSYLTNAIMDITNRYSKNGVPLPIVVTETGAPLKDPERKIEFLKGAFRGISEAIKKGADVRGVYIWNLLSNDEFRKDPERSDFGLIHMDPKTHQKTVTKAAEFLAEVNAKLEELRKNDSTSKHLPFDEIS